MTQTIIPNLWFDGNAEQAVEFYCSVFPESKTLETMRYPNEGLADFQKDMAGKPLVIEFEIGGQHFTAINADDTFKPTPAISFFVNFDPSRDDAAREHLDEMWTKLVDGGRVLMEIGEYPYSKRYGWVEDRYGVSWQLILTDPAGEPRPFIVPSFFFCGQVQNQARAALDFYTSVFKDAKIGTVATYGQAFGPVTADSMAYGEFQVGKQWFAAMDSGADNDHAFTEGISMVVMCQDQAEIDYYWERLRHVPEAEQCGWLKDKFGVSWQIVPIGINDLVSNPSGYAKMMTMKKLVIDELKS